MNTITSVLAVCLAAPPASGGAPVEGAPVEGAPVEGAPVEGAPVEGAPVEGAPVEGAPVEAAPGDVPTDPGVAEQPGPDSDAAAASDPAATPQQDVAAPAAPVHRPQFGFDPEPAPTPDASAATAEPAFDAPVGGYWKPTDTKEIPPSDGRRKILIGSLLAPLGLVATSTGAAFTYVSIPQHCVVRYASIGIETSRSRCGGLLALNIIRTSYGGLLLITGTVLLVLGLRERNVRREWDRHHTAGKFRRRRVAVSADSNGLMLRF